MKCFISYKSDAVMDVKDLRLSPIVFVELEEVAIGIGHLRVIQKFLKNCEIFVRADFFFNPSSKINFMVFNFIWGH